jgi:hypothetical protein
MTADVIQLRRRNAEAQRRWRAREKKCLASSWIDYGPLTLTVLIARKLLTQAEADRNDKKEIRKALTQYHADVVAEDIRKNFPELS